MLDGTVAIAVDKTEHLNFHFLGWPHAISAARKVKELLSPPRPCGKYPRSILKGHILWNSSPPDRRPP